MIKNPNFGLTNRVSHLKDTTSAYIPVPCGHCSECVHNRQMSVLQRVQTQAIDHHVFFGTFTYNEEMIPKRQFIKLDEDTGEEIEIFVRYADMNDFQDAIKRIRKDDLFTRPFSYLVCNEFGSERGRPHFHCLFFLPMYPEDTWMDIYNLEYTLFHVFLSQWKRNVNVIPGKFCKAVGNQPPRPKVNTRNPIWKPLCTYYRRMICGQLSTNYDLHYVKPLVGSDSSSVAAYVTKYMMKPSEKETRLQQALRLNLSEDEYKQFWAIARPRWKASRDFGLRTQTEIDFVRKSVIASKAGFLSPMYLAGNGNTYPLARYYRNDQRVISIDDFEEFYQMDPQREIFDNFQFTRLDPSQVSSRMDHFKRMQSVIDSHDTFSLISDLIENARCSTLDASERGSIEDSAQPE